MAIFSIWPPGQVSYKFIPSLLPGFHGSLFINIQQSAEPAGEKAPRSAPGERVGQKVRGSQMLAEHISPQSKSSNETEAMCGKHTETFLVSAPKFQER